MYVKTWTKRGGMGWWERGVEMQDVVVVVLYAAEGWALMFSGGEGGEHGDDEEGVVLIFGNGKMGEVGMLGGLGQVLCSGV